MNNKIFWKTFEPLLTKESFCQRPTSEMTYYTHINSLHRFIREAAELFMVLSIIPPL
jgi:hypothetical protein